MTSYSSSNEFLNLQKELRVLFYSPAFLLAFRSFGMFRSIIRVLAFSTFTNSAVIIHRQDVAFHYMPIDFDYGYDSKVTTNFRVETGPNSEPFKIVMDTGSSDFWVSHLIYFLAINPNIHHRYGNPKQLSTTTHNISSSWDLVMSQHQQNTTPHSHLPLS